MEQPLIAPAYEMLLACSHTFCLIDALGAISATERTGIHRSPLNAASASRKGARKAQPAAGSLLVEELPPKLLGSLTGSF